MRSPPEIDFLTRLDHPNIVSLFDTGDFDGAPWYAMSYVRGETLRDRLAREGQLTIAESIHIARETAKALRMPMRLESCTAT